MREITDFPLSYTHKAAPGWVWWCDAAISRYHKKTCLFCGGPKWPDYLSFNYYYDYIPHQATSAPAAGARQPGVPGHLGMVLDPSLASASPEARHNTDMLPVPLVAMNSDCVAIPGSSPPPRWIFRALTGVVFYCFWLTIQRKNMESIKNKNKHFQCSPSFSCSLPP